MSGMADMTPTSLAAAVEPRTGKIIMASVFLKEERICYKMVYLMHRFEPEVPYFFDSFSLMANLH